MPYVYAQVLVRIAYILAEMENWPDAIQYQSMAIDTLEEEYEN